MYFDLQRSSSRSLGLRGSSSSYPHQMSSPSFLSSLTALASRNKRVVILTTLTLAGVLFFLFAPEGYFGFIGDSPSSNTRGTLRALPPSMQCRYSNQQIWTKYSETSNTYSFAIISDMDKKSKMTDGKQWRSILKKGTLTRDVETGKYSVKWTKDVELTSALNEAGRAMELSDLTYFNGDLLAFDDRTGVAFKVEGEQLIPWRILMDGDGESTKGMKIEWATVKDDLLYVGSTGKEWTTPAGEFVSNNPLWVKTIDKEGRVSNVDWYAVYTALRKETSTLFPAYLLHESVRWRAVDRRWYFFPRRVSTLPYDEALDEERGSNLVISVDENFEDPKVIRLGPQIPSHGFSAFQFVPWRENEVIALKSEEHGDKINTFITVFDLNDGSILMPEEHIDNIKFEGLEIL